MFCICAVPAAPFSRSATSNKAAAQFYIMRRVGHLAVCVRSCWTASVDCRLGGCCRAVVPQSDSQRRSSALKTSPGCIRSRPAPLELCKGLPIIQRHLTFEGVESTLTLFWFYGCRVDVSVSSFLSSPSLLAGIVPVVWFSMPSRMLSVLSR